MEPILDLQQFAEENQCHGLIDGLGVAPEEYIKEASPDEDEKDLSLYELSNV